MKYEECVPGKWYKFLSVSLKGVYCKNEAIGMGINTLPGQIGFLGKCIVTNDLYHKVIEELSKKEIAWVKHCIKVKHVSDINDFVYSIDEFSII